MDLWNRQSGMGAQLPPPVLTKLSVIQVQQRFVYQSFSLLHFSAIRYSIDTRDVWYISIQQYVDTYQYSSMLILWLSWYISIQQYMLILWLSWYISIQQYVDTLIIMIHINTAVHWYSDYHDTYQYSSICWYSDYHDTYQYSSMLILWLSWYISIQQYVDTLIIMIHINTAVCWYSDYHDTTLCHMSIEISASTEQ